MVLTVEMLKIREDVRQARDAESAHLEAALKIHGAKVLRLARLKDVLRERGFDEQTGFELRVIPGEEPLLWLDLRHCVVMQPDAGTYRLALHGIDKIDVALETASLDETVAACTKVLAHSLVRSHRSEPTPALQHDLIVSINNTTLLYVWLTGVITGIAALLLYGILLKKLPF